MHLMKQIYVLNIHILYEDFTAVFAITRRRKVQKKATAFLPSRMYSSLLLSSFQTSGMAPLEKKEQHKKSCLLSHSAEQKTATAVLLLTDNLILKTNFSVPLLISFPLAK